VHNEPSHILCFRKGRYEVKFTAADYLVGLLANIGVRRIYGVAGTAIFPLLDAISRQPNLTFVAATNELSAGYMALTEARLTGGLGVCTATSGPGAAGLASPVADAYFDAQPLLAITGQVKVAQVATGTSQYFAQQSFYQSITGLSEQVFSGSALREVLTRAIGTALTERTAVHLGIPGDVFAQAVEAGLPELTWQPLENRSGDIQATADQIRSFRRPLILLGSEAASTTGDWLHLAEKLGAVLVVAQAAKGLVGGDHYLNIGGIGESYLPSVVSKADGIIMIGSAPYEKPFLPRVPTVQIATKTGNLDWSLPLVAPLTGNFTYLAKKLMEIVPRQNTDSTWVAEIAESRKELQRQLTAEAKHSEEPIHPSKLMSALSLHIAEDAIIALDIGAFIHWFDKSFWAKKQTVLLSNYWRGIGAGLPAAIAAKMADQVRQVVAIVGDGGLLLNSGELATLSRYNLAVVVIVVNNGSYDLERQKMQQKGASLVGTDLPQVDFNHLAAAYQLAYRAVSNVGELDSALTEALAATEPILVNVYCSSPELVDLVVL